MSGRLLRRRWGRTMGGTRVVSALLQSLISSRRWIEYGILKPAVLCLSAKVSVFQYDRFILPHASRP